MAAARFMGSVLRRYNPPTLTNWGGGGGDLTTGGGVGGPPPNCTTGLANLGMCLMCMVGLMGGGAATTRFSKYSWCPVRTEVVNEFLRRIHSELPRMAPCSSMLAAILELGWFWFK